MTIQPGAGAPSVPDGARTKVIKCLSCGGRSTLRALGQSVMVACSYCHSQLDISQPEIRLIRAYQEQEKRLRIPLGTRGTLRGQELEVIGAIQRRDAPSGYAWEEYLLFSPFLGFRWLVYDQGHWNLGQTVKDTTKIISVGALRYDGRVYRPFDQGLAVVEWVTGEFYWRVATGDRAETRDYVSPPRMLSREKTGAEVVWTMLNYLEPNEVEEAFGADGLERNTVAANQPNPTSRAWASIALVMWIALAALFVIQIGSALRARNLDYSVGSYEFPRKAGEEDQVYGPFTFSSRRSVNELIANASLSNSWVELNGSLVNTDTGKSYDFSNSLQYYNGVDGDGAWTEGSNQGTALLTTIPAGTYKLIVEGSGGSQFGPLSTSVSLRLHHDVLPWSNFWLALVWILAYPAYLMFRYLTFEKSRWAESGLHPHKS